MKQGKRKAENEIDKLFMCRKKHQKKKRPRVVTSSSKNDERNYHDFSSDEDVPLPKKFPLNGSAKDELSGSEDDSTSAGEENEDAASEKEELSSRSSAEDDPSSSSDGSSSSTEEDVGVNKELAASIKEESSREGSRSSAEADVNVNKAPAGSDEDEAKKTSDCTDSDADKGKAVAVSEKKADDCGRQEREEAWKENETEFLIAILYAELVIHEKDVNQLDWAGIVQKLYHQTRKQTSITEVQTLYKKFRDETTQFMDLLQVTGYEWNSNNNKVTCKDDVWEHIYWIHGGEKMFRKEGLLHYNVLRDIFGSGSIHFVQESDVQRTAQTPLTSTRFWSWLFG